MNNFARVLELMPYVNDISSRVTSPRLLNKHLYRHLAFENTSAFTKRVVPVVTFDLRDEIIRQLKEEITELRHGRSMLVEKVSLLGLH
ncbi:hypothetical protein RJT34_13155 [Clitoria ternatea]|uniref:Uncharacterized protein n=1 Tax=Clitoria ternatea TaxID=43366 RepID=A0AAN9PJY8_CLITE